MLNADAALCRWAKCVGELSGEEKPSRMSGKQDLIAPHCGCIFPISCLSHCSRMQTLHQCVTFRQSLGSGFLVCIGVQGHLQAAQDLRVSHQALLLFSVIVLGRPPWFCSCLGLCKLKGSDLEDVTHFVCLYGHRIPRPTRRALSLAIRRSVKVFIWRGRICESCWMWSERWSSGVPIRHQSSFSNLSSTQLDFQRPKSAFCVCGCRGSASGACVDILVWEPMSPTSTVVAPSAALTFLLAFGTEGEVKESVWEGRLFSFVSADRGIIQSDLKAPPTVKCCFEVIWKCVF